MKSSDQTKYLTGTPDFSYFEFMSYVEERCGRRFYAHSDMIAFLVAIQYPQVQTSFRYDHAVRYIKTHKDIVDFYLL